MEALYRFFSGAAAAVASLFAPVAPSVVCVAVFIAVDFATGVAASRAIARRSGREWYFESREAWRTVLKAGFVMTAIAMTWLVECCVLDFMSLNMAKIFAGFACGVELWSFLENASQLSSSPQLTWLKRYVRHRMEREAGDE